MKLLVQAGLVTAEKSGRWVYYRTDRAAFATAADYLAGFTSEPPVSASGKRPSSQPHESVN